MDRTSVYLEVSIDCPSCGHTQAVNGAAQSVLCSGCQAVLELPPELWRSLLQDQVAQAISMPETQARPSTVFGLGGGLTAHTVYGKLTARCAACKHPFPDRSANSWTGSVACEQCGRTTGARAVPEWFKTVHPGAVALLGENLPAERATADPRSEPISISCVSCGASLAADGGSRTVECRYCTAQNFLPDSLWLRLHPQETRFPWFVQLELEDVGLALPDSASTFYGACVGQDGVDLIAWSDTVGGDPGFLAWIDGSGRTTRIASDFALGDLELVGAPDGSRFALLGRGHRTNCLRLFDSQDGRPRSTINGVPTDEIDVLDPSAVRSPCFDNAQVALVPGSDEIILLSGATPYPLLLRYGERGQQKPMWPAAPKPGLLARMLSSSGWQNLETWEQLADFPTELPRQGRLAMSAAGELVLLHEELRAIARFDASGRMLEQRALTPPTAGLHGLVRNMGVALDGTTFAVANLNINGRVWAHIVRIPPGGPLEVHVGPASDGDALLSYGDRHLAVHPDGSLFAGGRMDSLRRFAPDGAATWVSRATANEDRKRIAEGRALP